MPYDNFDRFIPHKKDIKMQTRINSSTNYDLKKSELLDGVNSELEAQNVDDLAIKDIFKAAQQEKDEYINNDEKKYTDIYLPIAIDNKTAEKYFVAGTEITILFNGGCTYLQSSNDNLEKTYLTWAASKSIDGFSSIKDYYVLLNAFASIESFEDASFILDRLIKTNYKNSLELFVRDDLNSKGISDSERAKLVQERLIRLVTNYTYLLKIPLGFSRLETVKKFNIIDGCIIYSINLNDNDIDEISFIVRNDSLSSIDISNINIASFNFNNPNKKYLVDEALENQANNPELIEESVYSSIGDSLVL